MSENQVTAEVERVARAIYEKRNGGGAMAWRHRDAKHKAPYYSDALAAMGALLEPTKEMIDAGNLGLFQFEDCFEMTTDEVRGVWRAMLLKAMGR